MKSHNIRIIKDRRTYTPSEIGKLHKIRVGTVYRWMKEGLLPIQKQTNPLLIYGEELKRFLLERQGRNKVKLKQNEFFCLKCRAAKTGSSVKMEKTGKRVGKDNCEQQQKVASCRDCGSTMRRFAKTSPKRIN